MKSFTVVIERCPDTGFYVGYVPGFPGAHSQGETVDELYENIREVIAIGVTQLVEFCTEVLSDTSESLLGRFGPLPRTN